MTMELDDKLAHVIGSAKQSGRWKQYWERYTRKQFPKKCQIFGCSNQATDGAHVWVKHLHQNFILPTCHACNVGKEHRYDGSSTDWASAKANALVVRVEPHDNTYE